MVNDRSNYTPLKMNRGTLLPFSFLFLGRERIDGNLRGMSPSKTLFINSFNWSAMNGERNTKTIHFLILNKLLKYQQYIITNSSDMVNLHNNLTFSLFPSYNQRHLTTKERENIELVWMCDFFLLLFIQLNSKL